MPEIQMDFLDDREEAQEGESDLGPLSENELADAIVNATDWTIETILSQINKGNILLDPKFQRRDAWRKARKSEFIESLFLGLPVPQIVLANLKDKKGKYIIIDGKQRLLSIRQFASGPDDKVFEELKLSSLTVKKELNGKSLRTLKNKPEFTDDVNAFENETIRTVVIKNWPNEAFLYRVFLRLNTNSVGLSPQELRQALHPGEFIDFADEASKNSVAIKEILHIEKPDFRMRDVEIFIRYFAYRYFLHSYAGSMKSFLDTTCMELNARWATKDKELRATAEDLEHAHRTTKTIFGKHSYRKWIQDKYEGRFNRAIFDVMTYYFSRDDVLSKVSGNEVALENAFKELCTSDQNFLASIERTTKSIESTCYRFAKWAETLNNVLGTNLSVFSIQNNRIL